MFDFGTILHPVGTDDNGSNTNRKSQVVKRQGHRVTKRLQKLAK